MCGNQIIVDQSKPTKNTSLCEANSNTLPFPVLAEEEDIFCEYADISEQYDDSFIRKRF